MKKVIPLLFLVISFHALSQDKHQMDSVQTVLNGICKKLFSAKADTDKHKYNQELHKIFEDALNRDPTMAYGFDSLKNDIGILKSPDEKFRIVHWNIHKEDGSFEYYGFIQSRHTEIKKKGLFIKQKTETVHLYTLTDKSAEIKNPENYIGDHKKWFGMLYYRIIIKKSKSKTYYTLLGWDGNDKFSQKKIIDVLTFDNKGIPHFGADIFNFAKRFPKRVIFEYSTTCSMALKYNEKMDSIVFDRLVPSEERLEGQFQYYCASFEYDGLGFKKGKWNFGAGLHPGNEKDKNDKLYNNPNGTSDKRKSDVMKAPAPKKKKK